MTIHLLNSDARHIPLADQSVQCVVTSPPYWGLRDYGTAQWIDGDPDCDHKPGKLSRVGKTTLQGGKATSGHLQEGYKHTCEKCGAVRIDKQIGLERTPQEYVANIVKVMREVWRVLRPNGVVWLNLGDSYASAEANRTVSQVIGSSTLGGGRRTQIQSRNQNSKIVGGLKPKDLVGIPWRVAFALQDDGWYLRSDIIWSKPNPMPESVTDRPTKAHEYIFLLAKSEHYYYDSVAIREPSVEKNWESRLMRDSDKSFPTDQVNGIRTRSAYSFSRKVNESPKPGLPNQHRSDRDDIEYSGQRNRRSVWTVATTPYSGAHFATFPPALVEPMILAGSKQGDIVLDPFSGSGTVGRVSAKHGRRYIGLDLNPSYIELAHERTSKIQIAMPLGIGVQTNQL